MSSVHIYKATGQHYQVRVRKSGHKKYIVFGKPTKSIHVACRIMANSMSLYTYKRAQIIMFADYYDPIVLFEMVRV